MCENLGYLKCSTSSQHLLHIMLSIPLFKVLFPHLIFQPFSLINQSVEVAKSGRVPAGKTEIPFELPLVQRSTSKTLHETYHGAYIMIHYSLRCELKRSLLAKDINKSQEFIVEHRVGRKLM